MRLAQSGCTFTLIVIGAEKGAVDECCKSEGSTLNFTNVRPVLL